MNKFYVYMYLRGRNSKYGKAGSPYYIGKGKGMRAYSKQHRVRPPADKSRIVFVVRDISEREALQEEKRLIELYGRIDRGTGCLRNFTDGGEGPSGCIRTPEQIERHRLLITGRPNPKNCRPWSEERKAEWSAQKKGVKWSQKRRNAQRPYKHTEETRRKMSAAQRGMSKSSKGKPWSEARRAAHDLRIKSKEENEVTL